MRDPELVLCAQRAAARLEDAWDRWRTSRGPDGASAGEVSSYVGYSQNEPRGRPRVVVGVDAEEAERLAALLDSGCAQRTPADGGGDTNTEGSAAGSTGESADGGEDGGDSNGAANGSDAYQGADGVRQGADGARQETAGPEACEICGAVHMEDESNEAEQAGLSWEPAPGPGPVPPQHVHPQQPVPAQRQATSQRPAGTQTVPAQPVPAPPATVQPARARPFPAHPAAAQPVPGVPTVGTVGQGPARDSAGTGEPGDAPGDASGAGAGEPGAAPQPPVGKGQAGKAGQAGPEDAQAEPDGEGADEWATVGSIPAELSGWASAALPNQAYTGLAAWVAACSEPDDQDTGSLPRSA
jgi:hypothetical protein